MRAQPSPYRAPAAASGSPPDAPYVESLKEFPSELLFIMGCHRSGTSLLHHLLAYTGQVDYVTTYDVIHYDSLLFNRATGREQAVRAALQKELGAEKDRGLDRLPVGADLPEEYRFILTSFHIPMGWQSRRRIDEIFAPHITPRTFERFVELCRKKRHLAPRDLPLVLKNPADHYFNFLDVHRMFPTAKFVFIHRHPLHVLNSYFQSFSPMLEKKSSYWAKLDKGYEEFFDRFSVKRLLAAASMGTNWYTAAVLGRLVDSFGYYIDNIGRIPEDLRVVLRYEDLCRDPQAGMIEIGTRLRLNITPRIPPRFVEPRLLPVLPRVKRQYARKLRALEPYLNHCRYETYP